MVGQTPSSECKVQMLFVPCCRVLKGEQSRSKSSGEAGNSLIRASPIAPINQDPDRAHYLRQKLGLACFFIGALPHRHHHLLRSCAAFSTFNVRLLGNAREVSLRSLFILAPSINFLSNSAISPSSTSFEVQHDAAKEGSRIQ